MNDLPDTYGDRVFISNADGYVPADIPFLPSTRDAWAALPAEWHDHPNQLLPPALFRWAVLTDKFARHGTINVSSELRRLEVHIAKLAADTAEPEQEQPAAVPDHVGLDAMLDEILSNGA
jgi:hypothetical protein